MNQEPREQWVKTAGIKSNKLVRALNAVDATLFNTSLDQYTKRAYLREVEYQLLQAAYDVVMAFFMTEENMPRDYFPTHSVRAFSF